MLLIFFIFLIFVFNFIDNELDIVIFFYIKRYIIILFFNRLDEVKKVLLIYKNNVKN